MKGKQTSAPNQLAAVAPNSLPHTMVQGPMDDSSWLSQVRSRISATTDSAALRVPHSTAKNQYSPSATRGVVMSPDGATEPAAKTRSSSAAIGAGRGGGAAGRGGRGGAGGRAAPA